MRYAKRKLTPWDAAAIRLVLSGSGAPTVADVARAFGISRRAVRAVRDGLYWST